MNVADAAAVWAYLDEIARLLPRVWDVLDASSRNRKLLAGPRPGERALCDVPEHRAEGWVEPCLACRVWAERRGLKPALGSVVVRAPVVDAAVEAELVLQDLERRVIEHLRVCPYPSRMVTPVGRARRLRDDLMPLVEEPALLARAVRDLGGAVEALSRAIDGEPTSRLPADCPHCGRRTLVVYHDEGVIRCEPRPGQVCVCSVPDCRCHDGRRHEWRRARGTGRHGEWGVLARLLEEG